MVDILALVLHHDEQTVLCAVEPRACNRRTIAAARYKYSKPVARSNRAGV